MKYPTVLAGILLCAGCVSLTSFQSPQALPPGSTSFGGGLAVNYPLPEADFLFRYGLFNSVDVGGKVQLPFMSGTVDVKWQFLRGPVAAAFDVGGSYSHAPDLWNTRNRGTDVFGAYPELIAGAESYHAAVRMMMMHKDEYLTYRDGPQSSYTIWYPQVFVGGSVGERFRVTAELSFTFWDPPSSPVVGIGLAFTYCPEAVRRRFERRTVD